MASLTRRESVQLNTMTIGTIVCATSMVIAQIYVDTDSVGQTIFTALIAALMVFVVLKLVRGMRERLSHDGIERVPTTPPARSVQIALWIMAGVMWVLALTMVVAAFLNPSVSVTFNTFAILSFSLCATAAASFLSDMRKQFYTQYPEAK